MEDCPAVPLGTVTMIRLNFTVALSYSSGLSHSRAYRCVVSSRIFLIRVVTTSAEGTLKKYSEISLGRFSEQPHKTIVNCS